MILLLRIILLPIFPIMCLVIILRNWLYDCGLISSYKPRIKCVSIGNIKVGGTGKTPFTNMLIGHLKKTGRVVLLSRGYGRKTSGYILATSNSTSSEIGDEVKMLSLYHPDIEVAVCENRVEGVENLISDIGIIDTILLDDAMQHRAILPQVNIMLTEYDKPYYKDYLFPVGMLRDVRRSVKRANIIIVTKSPKQLNVQQMDQIVKEMKHVKTENIFFSTYDSKWPISLFSEDKTPLTKGARVVVLTAIANPTKFIDNISENYDIIDRYIYRDHYSFSSKEILRVIEFAKQNGAVVVMTPKDSVKVEDMPNIPIEYRNLLYVQDIEYRILEYRGRDINSLINQINRIK